MGDVDDVAIWREVLPEGFLMELANGASPIFAQGDRFFLDVASSGDDLVLTWDSADGQLFNVRSETDPSNGEPDTWPIHDNHADLEATPPQNVLTIPRPAEASRFFVIESFPAPPESIYFDDFENGRGDWEIGSDGPNDDTVWELGAPTSGPGTANSPTNCFATNLAGDYGFEADVWLRSPVIDLTAAGGATLNFAQFKDIEEGFDFGTIRVLNAADDSQLAIVETPVDGLSAEWENESLSIPAEGLGQMIKIEFRFESDDISNFAGWYLDDVNVTVP